MNRINSTFWFAEKFHHAIFFCLFYCLLFSTNQLKAQYAFAFYPINNNSTTTGFSSGCISVQPMVVGASFGSTSYSKAGIKLKQSVNPANWPSSPTDGLHLDFKINPNTTSDARLDTITIGTSLNSLSAANFLVQFWYQVDAQPFVQLTASSLFASSTTPVKMKYFPVGLTMYAGHNYTFRCYVFNGPSSSGVMGKSDYGFIDSVRFGAFCIAPPASKPTASTLSAIPNPNNGKYACDAIGKYDTTTISSIYQTATQAGFVYSSTSTTPQLNAVGVSSMVIASNNGNISGTLNGLIPNTNYHIQTYIITQLDTIYGGVKQCLTDNFSIPIVKTSKPLNVLSAKATCGGYGTLTNGIGNNIIDSGGTLIISKGVYYSTSNPPTNLNKALPTPNSGSSPFNVTINNLQPQTKYYVQAFATNQLGTGLGSVDSFTTGTAVPSLSASPLMLDFGDAIYNNNAPILSYTLVGNNLTPLNGTITITINQPLGFVLSTSVTKFPSSPIANITINYSNGKFKIPIYVKLLTNNYGSYKSLISHNGGGVANQDADTVSVTGNVIPSPDQLSNMGTDFWTGFAMEENMSTATTQFDTLPKNSGLGPAAKGAHLSLYIATGKQAANVVVDLPGLPGAVSFPRNITIPPNSVVQVGGFPVGDGTPTNPTNQIDSRLYSTGISSRGIHIYTTNGVPVACFLYDWATNNSAAGAMLFPTNTWNSSYAVQAYGGTISNSGVPNSFFFVITNDDNTLLTITPTMDIIDSASSPVIVKNGGTIKYPKNQPFQVLLKKKGDVFNAVGLVDVSTKVGYDLTGTQISTDCSKKIAVFGGNARTLINTSSCNGNTSGSDNLVQQMFPKVAWGTKYLTVPTKSMEFNMFRVSVSNPLTQVKVNNVLYTTASPSWNATGSFYEFTSNKPLLIEGNEPISVTQFIMPGGSCGGQNVGNNGSGDPEMILLSPIQQAINQTTVFCPGFKDGDAGGAYINVIIPRKGVDSFKIDNKIATSIVDTGNSSYTGVAYGSSSSVLLKNAFVKHIGDTSYRYAKFHVTYPSTHTLSSNVPFNAIAYGVANGESWGFNAGTTINNLSSIKISQNQFGGDTSTSSIKTCKNTKVGLQIALPYLPSLVDSILWSAPLNANINFSGSSFTGPIMPNPSNPSKNYADTSGTIIVNGQTFYLYTCPVSFSFSEYGYYPITATAHGTFNSDCAGIDAQKIYVEVATDNINFKAIPVGCGSTQVNFLDSSTALHGTNIVKWNWDFGDNTTFSSIDSSKPNPIPNPHTYPSLNKYTAKLTTINSIGCASTDSVNLNLAFGLNAKYGISNDTTCIGTTVMFSDSSTNNAVSWSWNFDDASSGANNTSNFPNPSHAFITSGVHTVSLQVFTVGGCPSNIFKDSVYISPNPKPDFSFGGVCLPGSTVFTNKSDTITGFIPYGYNWNFGDNQPTTNTTNGVHSYNPPVPTGGYSVKLITTNKFGCIDSISKQVTSIYDKPIASFIVSNILNCRKDPVTITSTSTINQQTIGNYFWDFGDGNSLNSTNQTISHQYDTVGVFNIKLVVTSTPGSCLSDTVLNPVNINPLPNTGFIIPSGCLSSGLITFIDTSKIDNTLYPTTPPHSITAWSWNFNDINDATGSNLQNGQHNFTQVGTYSIIEKVTSSDGCFASDTLPFTILGTKPKPYFIINHKDSLCFGFPVTLIDTSRIDIGKISRVDIQWDINDPTTISTDYSPSTGANGSSKIYNYTYPSVGSYTIKLIAYTGNGINCKDSITTLNPIVIHSKPVANFVLPSSCLTGGVATFTDATLLNGIPIPSNATWSWSFSDPTDNTISVLQNGQHTFTQANAYTIKEVVISNNGCSDSITKPFIISGSKPVPAFVLSNLNNICSGNSFTIKDTSRLAIGKLTQLNVFWDTSNINSLNSVYTLNPTNNGSIGSSQTYSFVYPITNTDQTYGIRLVAYSGTGCADSITQLIIVHAKPKISWINPLSSICLNAAPITITGAIELNGLQPGVSGFNYFGNGVLGNKFNPALTSIGRDTLTAIFTSSAGCKDTAKQYIDVIPLPTPKMIISSPLCVNRDITFSDNSTTVVGTSITNIIWNFGDAQTAYFGNNLIHSYSNADTFKVSLVVSNNVGCSSDILFKNIIIKPLPTVRFALPVSICLPDAVGFFSDSSTLSGYKNPIFNYVWEFGDATNQLTTSLKMVSHSFSKPFQNSYRVKLTTTSVDGCYDTLSQVMSSKIIHTQPTATMVAFPTEICLGDTIHVMDLSAGSIVTSIWYWGDGKIDSTSANSFSHIYSFPNTTYSIQHKVIDHNGCKSVNTADTVVNVHPLPFVDEGVTQYVLSGDSIVLQPKVVGDILKYKWMSFGAIRYLNNDSILNPVCTPTSDSTFIYTLHVTSKGGCSNEGSLKVVVLTTVLVPNVFSPNGDGVHDTWDVSALSKYPGVTIKVFNRYGQLVYNAIGYANAWDGKLNGQPLPIGTYYYIISPKNGVKDISGSVTIIR